jgi:GNAT superfamily N-acetyltransferase
MDSEPDEGNRLSSLRFVFGEPDQSVAERLGEEVGQAFGPRDETALSIRAVDAEGALAAGVNCLIHWRWLYVRHLWVDASWRNLGLGTALLRKVESRAEDRACTGIYIDTFEPRAVAFYQRHGFRIFGALDDFPPGFCRTFLFKRLEVKRIPE